MELTLGQIDIYYNDLKQAFENKEKDFPLDFLYILYKNKKKLEEIVEIIKMFKIQIIAKYGYKKNQQWYLKPENVKNAQKELDDFLNIKENVAITFINIDNISGSVKLTNSQMNAIMFMIKE